MCRHWRNVALRCPRLWSSILVTDTTPKAPIHTLLSRSKSSPLHVTLNLRRRADQLFVIKDSLVHTTYLRLRLASDLWADAARVFQVPLTKLQTLELNHYCISGRLSSHKISIGNLPALTSLKIVGLQNLCTLSMNHPIITHFELSMSPSIHKISNDRAVFAALRSMSTLVALKLHIFHCTPPPEEIRDDNQLVFPCLADFYLSGRLDSVPPWLDIIQLPPSASVHLSLHNPYEEPAAVSQLDGSLSRLLRSPWGQAVLPSQSHLFFMFHVVGTEHPLAEENGRGQVYHIRLWTGLESESMLGVHQRDGPPTQRRDLNIYINSNTTSSPMFTSICRQLPLDRVHTLDLAAPPPFSNPLFRIPTYKPLKVCFSRMHSIQRLTIRDWTTVWLHGLFVSEAMLDVDSTAAERCIFSSVTHLTVENVSGDAESMQRALREWREECGAPLEELSLLNCPDVSPESPPLLASLADRVSYTSPMTCR